VYLTKQIPLIDQQVVDVVRAETKIYIRGVAAMSMNESVAYLVPQIN